MNCKAEKKLTNLVLNPEFPEGEIHHSKEWFQQQFENIDDDDDTSCSLHDFAIFFLNELKQHTEVHLKVSAVNEGKTTESAVLDDITRADLETPVKLLSSSTSRQMASVSVDRKQNNSTPTKRDHSLTSSQKQSGTPQLANKNGSSGLCLGDFIIAGSPFSHRNNKKKTPQNNNKSNNQKEVSVEKRKKRVVPVAAKRLEISYNSVFAGESSFSNDNNILQIADTEVEDKQQCAVLAARNILKTNADEISKQLQITTPLLLPDAHTTILTEYHCSEVNMKEKPHVEKVFQSLQNVECKPKLDVLAKIYSILIDLNFTVSVLSELSFLINLCNSAPFAATAPADCMESTCQSVQDLSLTHVSHSLGDAATSTNFACLTNIKEAIYFASRTLFFQKRTLALLDTESLNVVLNSVCCCHYMSSENRLLLQEILQHKLQMQSQKSTRLGGREISLKPSFANVYFQEDNNSREHFTCQQEFTNFRAQRDLFYKCLNAWETNHLNPSWSFRTEITPKLKEIFHISESFVNMAHFAKLFVSQLLVSTSNVSPSPEEIGLEVDHDKFQKLSQRLVAPSKFSTHYQFPRMESFFHNFIDEARSPAFIEQLKMELSSELITLNDCSFNQIKLTVDDDEDDDDTEGSPAHTLHPDLYIVKRDVMASMLLLGKFLGYVTSLPYCLNKGYGGTKTPIEMERSQIQLRNMMQSRFNTATILLHALCQGKLLITLPWMVQYYAMLDNIGLQLENNIKTLHIMFGLYMTLGLKDQLEKFNTATFIIRACFGWLFETKQDLSEQYYAFRAVHSCQNSNDFGKELQAIATSLSIYNLPESKGTGTTSSRMYNFNPLLETMLITICPFLAEFRVSIIPARYTFTKNASRTGKYRHITPRITELPTTPRRQQSPSDNVPPCSGQIRLVQAFRHSLNASTRLLINFCIERCYKSTVKDGHYKILMPSKQAADDLVNKINSTDYRTVYKEVEKIYTTAKADALKLWNATIPQVLEQRINKILEGFLPEETCASVLRKTYFYIIQDEVAQRVNDWMHINMFKNNFYCNVMPHLANKICNANKSRTQRSGGPSSELHITQLEPSLSNLLEELQYWLHCTSVRQDCFHDLDAILTLLKQLPQTFRNPLPSLLYYAIATNVVQLMKHIIASRNVELSTEVILAACHIWLHPNMQNAVTTSNSLENDNSIFGQPNVYEGLITVPFIESLGITHACYDQLAKLLIIMINNQVISLNYVDDLFSTLFKHPLDRVLFKEVGEMLCNVIRETDAMHCPLENDNHDK